MACQRPGPICRIASGSKIDAGTTARNEQQPPGTLKTLYDSWLDNVNEWYQGAAEWASESESVEWGVRQILRLFSTKSAEFFAHYLDDTGKTIVLNPVPMDWQEAIRRNWKTSIKKEYKFKEPNKYRIGPYHWGVPDLRNALGHFNLTVTDREYIIEDVYEFYYRTDKGQVVRHGPCLTEDDETGARMQRLAKTLLPQKAYKNPYATGSSQEERFEVVKEKDGWYFYLPTEWLLKHGKKFDIKGRFSK